MGTKAELQEFISQRFKAHASPMFIQRACAVIEEASDEKKSLTSAAGRVSKMVSLFIDKNLGKGIYESLKAIIDRDLPSS